MRIGMFGGSINDGTTETAGPEDIAITGAEAEVIDRIGALADIGVTDFAAVEFPGNPDEAAATREAVKKAMA